MPQNSDPGSLVKNLPLMQFGILGSMLIFAIVGWFIGSSKDRALFETISPELCAFISAGFFLPFFLLTLHVRQKSANMREPGIALLTFDFILTAIAEVPVVFALVHANLFGITDYFYALTGIGFLVWLYARRLASEDAERFRG
ncbi:MAG: hypothetical protein V1811_02095 [Candidatus Micrarchaeota archaeon]